MRASFGGLLGFVLIAVAPDASADLTSKWRIEYGNTTAEFIDVVQTGNTVGTTLHEPLGTTLDIQLSGTLTPGFPLGLSSNPSCAFLVATILPGENDLEGLFFAGAGCGSLGPSRAIVTRCECFDGNTTNGDGCDAQCRVEPCYTCTPIPSTCTPKAEGATCEDGSPCTTGEICTLGTCGGGSVVPPPCTDLTGSWNLQIFPEFFIVPPFDRPVTIEQRGTRVLSRLIPSGEPDMLGIVAPATGELEMRRFFPTAACSDLAGFTGSVATHGLSFTGTGGIEGLSIECFEVIYSVMGTLLSCGNGITDPPELCDDGDQDSGDGCDTNCTPTACGNGVLTDTEACDDGNLVAGDGCDAACKKEICGDGVIDFGEECDDANTTSGDGCDANCRVTGCPNGVKAGGEGCDDGNATNGDGCSATCTVEPCFRCDGFPDEPSDCHLRLPFYCAPPLAPGGATLRLRDAPVDKSDRISFALPEAESLSTLGDPLTSSAYDVCLIDDSQFPSKLLYGTTVAAGGVCGTHPCWKVVRSGFAYTNKATTPHGLRKLVMRPGTTGEPRAKVEGRGALLEAAPAGFPAPPLPTPLRFEIQNRDDFFTCYRAQFTAAGVTKNDPVSGRFKAKSQ